MKMTRKTVERLVREGMSEEDALCYVPIQKFTVAMCMLAVSDACRGCGSRKGCEWCEKSMLGRKLAAVVKTPPMLDEDGIPIPPRKEAPGLAKLGEKGKEGKE